MRMVSFLPEADICNEWKVRLLSSLMFTLFFDGQKLEVNSEKEYTVQWIITWRVDVMPPSEVSRNCPMWRAPRLFETVSPGMVRSQGWDFVFRARLM